MKNRNHNMDSRRSRRGNSLIEFTLVGIPVIFAIISIFIG